MISLRKSLVVALGLAVALALGCASEPRGIAALSDADVAKLTPWNQETVAGIADEFATTMNGVFVSVNSEKTGAQLGSGQASRYLRLKDRVRVTRNEARHLAVVLSKGKGRQETVHIYQRMMTLIRDAQEIGRNMYIEGPTLDRVVNATRLLEQLSPYYDPAAGE